MARAKTKTELLDATTTQWSKLQALIDSMRPNIETAGLFFGNDFNRPEAHWMRDKNLRDVLAHLLYAWQKMLLEFIDANQNGITRTFLPASHTWRTTPALTQEIWEHYQDVSLDEIQALLTASHTQTVELIESFSDEELSVNSEVGLSLTRYGEGKGTDA